MKYLMLGTSTKATQPVFTCSKLIIKILEGVKCVQS